MAVIGRFWIRESSETSYKSLFRASQANYHFELHPTQMDPEPTEEPEDLVWEVFHNELPIVSEDVADHIRFYPTVNCTFADHTDNRAHGFIIGPQKTGTTFLSSVLAEFPEHFPEILMSTPKETSFFKKDFETADDFEDFAWRDRDTKHKVLLESSASTIFEKGYEKIYPVFSNPRFIFIARNPTDRFFSHLNHQQRLILAPIEIAGERPPMDKAWNIMAQNATTVDKLRDAVAMLMEKKLDWYLYHGHYADLLKSWGHEIRCYSMMIINQKQMNAPVIREVFKHLGLARPPEYKIDEAIAESKKMYNVYKETWGEWWRKLPIADDETRKMLDDFYEEDNRKLWEMLNITDPWW